MDEDTYLRLVIRLQVTRDPFTGTPITHSTRVSHTRTDHVSICVVLLQTSCYRAFPQYAKMITIVNVWLIYNNPDVSFLE